MFTVQFNNLRMTRWQSRLARVPRWGWIAFFIGAVVPAAALAIFLIITFLFTGLVVMAAVLLLGAAIGMVRRLLHRRDDGRRNVQIVVRSVRVVDP